MKATKTLPPLVQIEWEDSAQPEAEWRYLDDLKALKPVRCTSVGFLVQDTATVKAVAPNIAGYGTASAQASGIIRIPARCVIRVKRLRR